MFDSKKCFLRGLYLRLKELIYGFHGLQIILGICITDTNFKYLN